MAYVLYTDGHRELPSEAEAIKLWRIKAGQARPETPAQKAYVDRIRKTVKKVRLNYRTAPTEYIQAHINEIVPYAIARWIVDRNGRPLRPGNKEDLEFAIKYGLWARHRPTLLVTGKGQLALM